MCSSSRSLTVLKNGQFTTYLRRKKAEERTGKYQKNDRQLTSIDGKYIEERAANTLTMTTAIICFLLLLLEYLIYKNLKTWSEIVQEKHLKMLRDREYVLLRAYRRELLFSRLLQETDDEEEVEP